MPDDLNHALTNLCKAYRNQLDIALSQHGLYVGQEMILRALWAEDGQTQARLAAQLRIEPPTVSKMVRRLARIGLISQRVADNDRRARLVFLTERGRTIRPAIEAACQTVAMQALASLTAEEVATFHRLMERVYWNLIGNELPDG
ncbi:MarR family winged helix-turn-helix transcriptional regulator [Chloroflexus sp.]|uniref:MarR family winged helix-turn-helix transcriptional regulator n=1 Tax=Chloroflexus sp. TaxID=1904827 RepID=UPI0026149510|nr:MarR family transcriptional regulator [uncultured Chloroflexus sp.]